MQLKKHLNSYISYNILLFFIFSVTINGFINFSIINIIFYCLVHFLIIYLGIYYYRKSLYLLYFLYGLGLDLFWINEIGSHLLVFMFFLIFFNLIEKHLYKFNSKQIYLLLIIVQLFMFCFEMLISQILFNYLFNFKLFLKISLISLVISYPVFYFFSKLDKLR